jgi:transketolase
MQDGWHSTQDADVVRHARVLPLDVVQAKGAGHAGTAVSLTPALYLLFQDYLRHDPAKPTWIGRDRFVLSCGHASLALYLQLFLSGYGLEMDDIQKTRTIGSATPGHPEFGHTVGVETTTGPLGQGIANAVGMAMESTRLARLMESPLFAHRVWCFASDGDVQEGIGHEASSLAGTLGLDGLILVWDDNSISIEGDTAITFSEDVSARYRAYGWTVVEILDAENPTAIRAGYEAALAVTGGPVFIRLKSRLGHPMPTVGGTAAAHSGAAGVDEVAATKEILGLDPAKSFHMPPALLTHSRQVAVRGARVRQAWAEGFLAWADGHPAQASVLARMTAKSDPAELESVLAAVRLEPRAVATRAASKAVLEAVTAILPELWGGSADLAEPNGTLLTSLESYLPAEVSNASWSGGPGGQLLHFGVREHAMGGILNGMALSGLTRPFGATFFVFADYMRPSVRLAALMNLPITYVWSHDSVAVGEDGPTHQPVEHLWSYRAIPGLSVVRPADWTETVDAWRRILTRPSGPVALVLSRQSVPIVEGTSTAADGAARGAYIVRGDVAVTPDVLILATGAEVQIALAAAELLNDEGLVARVISAPCLEWFEQESVDYRNSILPPGVEARVSVEAGTAQGWYRWIGTHGKAISVDSFGASGSGDLVLERKGITVRAVVEAARLSLESGAFLLSEGIRR